MPEVSVIFSLSFNPAAVPAYNAYGTAPKDDVPNSIHSLL